MDKVAKILKRFFWINVIIFVAAACLCLVVSYIAAIACVIGGAISLYFISILIRFVEEVIDLRSRVADLSSEIRFLKSHSSKGEASRSEQKAFSFNKDSAASSSPSFVSSVPQTIDRNSIRKKYAAMPAKKGLGIIIDGALTDDDSVFFTCPRCNTTQNANRRNCKECNVPIEYKK